MVESLSSGALLARLLDIADDAVIIVDESQRIVVFNQGAERIFGHAAAAVLGNPLTMLLPPAVAEGHSRHLRDFAVQAQASRRMGERSDIRGRRADGSLFDAEASIAHLEVDGQTYFTAIVRDVSDSRRAAQALMDSEARFRGLAEAAPVGIFETDAQGHCRYVNDRWCAIAGMAASDAMGEGWARALHPADRARVSQAWAEAMTTATPFEMRYRFMRPDGIEAWVMVNAVARRDGALRLCGWIGTITDITETHHQALALERAKTDAESAARAKSLFLANISHEIRTPLNAVIGMTTLLLDTPMAEDQRDFARTIRTSSDSLLSVINDILDFSKADAGKLEIEHQPFDLRRCVEDSLDLVMPRALEKNLNLALQIEDDTPEALIGDATRIRQILVNLLSNAVKFTRQGEVVINVDAQPLGDKVWQLRFAVRDTGIGIASDQLPRLFQSFSQLDASTTRRYGGTGLGLAICKRLAELMGGSVGAESVPGQGSVFRFELTLAESAGAEPVEYLQSNVPALAGKSVLIVDDNLTNRRILSKLALRWGMVPSTLASALEALDRLRHGETWDLAVLDMSMPEMDGVQLALEIRHRLTPEELPIVLLTSLGQRHAAEAGRALSLQACLSKPIKAGVLFKTLVGVLEGNGYDAPSPAPPPRPPVAHRVLVAEDNPMNQRVVLRMLQHLGVHAEIASNGREAVAMAARQSFDLVLMDIQMPELDGIEAARTIARQRGSNRLPRLVAMTANTLQGDREAYAAAGFDAYLPKPVELAELAAALGSPSASPRHGRGLNGDAVLDTARLEHLRSMQPDSGPSLVGELIDMFLLDSARHVHHLREAHSRGDAEGLRRSAHRFLSATQNIGALRLSRRCSELEAMGQASRLDAAPPLLARLDHERERVNAELTALRSSF